MKIAIVGVPFSGKSTLFKALTGMEGAIGEQKIGMVRVPDRRIDQLSSLYNPKKTTYASVEIVDICGAEGIQSNHHELGAKFLSAVRNSQVFVLVIDAFSQNIENLDTVKTIIETFDYELALSDYNQCEKRITRLKKQSIKPGPMQNEYDLLQKLSDWLSKGKPLRNNTELITSILLGSFAFLSAKPVLTVLNVSEDGLRAAPQPWCHDNAQESSCPFGETITICAQLESEIAGLPPDDAKDFLADYGIDSTAKDRIIRAGFDLLDTISFFTVGQDEVRAWCIGRGTCAKDAASAIHSDISRGFIRAEVSDFKSVINSGGFEEAKKLSRVRLEGKDYIVMDGDVISFRHNV